MPKGSIDYESISDSGNWNVADLYSKLKIGKQLILADEYYEIAVFGSSTLIEDFDVYLNNIPVDVRRWRGFERLIQTLVLIIDNSIFAIKKKVDKEKLEEHKKYLKKLWKIRSSLYEEITNQVSKTRKFKLDYEKYNKLLDALAEIKSEINEPLNNADLIFTSKTDFDPQAQKAKIKKDAVERG